MNRSRGNQLIDKLNDIGKSGMDFAEKSKLYYKILQYVFDEFTARVNIQLTSLFTKMAFVGNQFGVNRQLMYHLHNFRKRFESGTSFDRMESEEWNVKMGIGLQILISELLKIPFDRSAKDSYFKKFGVQSIYAKNQIIESADFVAIKVDDSEGIVLGYCPGDDSRSISLIFNEAGKNEIFWESLQTLNSLDLLPIHLRLHGIEVISENSWIPQIVVVQPSYLIDVTTIAECFSAKEAEPRLSVIKSFLPIQISKYLLLGNIANYLLDCIVTRPEKSFHEIRATLFHLAPIQFSLYSDDIVKEILQKSKVHFDNLTQTLAREFKNNGLERSGIYIEPSFLAPDYGIQGRLDLFHLNAANYKAAIIELKSGKAFRANHYGLSNNHYVQTLLYDLMIQAVYGKRFRRNNFILYSGEEGENLRYAPTLVSQQMEAIKVRNDILLEQYKLEKLSLIGEGIPDSFKKKHYATVSGFHKRDFRFFHNTYVELDLLTKQYFDLFTSFISIERRLAKTGTTGLEQTAGLASIWKKTTEEKIEDFDILNHLEIKLDQASEETPLLQFCRSEKTAVLSNFRVGDIAVVYPDLENRPSALYTQIFKGTIISIKGAEIVVRLRSQQFNPGIFKQSRYWHLEHDFLDSGYMLMYRSLFEFASASKDTKDRLLGITPPAPSVTSEVEIPADLTEEQSKLYKLAISSPDYFLLWGPPGTGKTSIMIRHLIDYFYREKGENLLILAYTNRAVDEICEAVMAITPELGRNFIRIGSRYATKEPFRQNLLANRIEAVSSRNEVTQLIQQTQVFVGTISSVLGKHGLFSLKKFDRIIVDEASQILEPNLIGLLTRIPKFLLIGDHYQLPAIVRQNKNQSEIRNDSLLKIGLKNCRDSLFERLYRNCMKNNWHWACGQLHEQGRMHETIMDFVNAEFYGGQLKALDFLEKLRRPLPFSSSSGLSGILSQHRMIYIPTRPDEILPGKKTNIYEARAVAKVISALLEIYERSGIHIVCDTLGVITPFRAQISMIRTKLSECADSQADISVDTVERYQGSARDVIIVSTCMNHPAQLRSLISKSSEGVDRKLNVAITRAREQFILIGNESVLAKDGVYSRLIKNCVVERSLFDSEE